MYKYNSNINMGPLKLTSEIFKVKKYECANSNGNFIYIEPNDLYNGGGKKVFRILKGTISLLTRNVTGNDVFVCNTDSQDPCNNCQ